MRSLYGLLLLLPPVFTLYQTFIWNDIAPVHIPYYFYNHPKTKQFCLTRPDSECPYKEVKEGCWGYEEVCPVTKRYHQPICPGSSNHWARTKKDQLRQFWEGADFGYVKVKRQDLHSVCLPDSSITSGPKSSLECVTHSLVCRARHIYIDLRNAGLQQRRSRYDDDIIKPGHIGGNCRVDGGVVKNKLSGHRSPLQSWYAEIENYSTINFTYENSCDVILDKPTFLIKIDAVVNLFHHFCDFVNLYLSQHWNQSDFSTDIYIIIWDTSIMRPRDAFNITWTAFTRHPVIFLPDYDGKRLCVEDAVFSFLPRMQYGLYYNMPLIPGCEGSGLVKAFSEHLMYRLGVKQWPIENKIRITLLSRETKYRNILNEHELLDALKKVANYEVQRVVYHWKMPFIEQLRISHNTDIFIGMHGAGLTHGLFMPDWGVLFELYSCEDENCYKDLARLRGVKYMTWDGKHGLTQQDEGHHPTLGAHAKFTNYAFDVDVFLSRILEAAQHVESHPAYIAMQHQNFQEHNTDDLKEKDTEAKHAEL